MAKTLIFFICLLFVLARGRSVWDDEECRRGNGPEIYIALPDKSRLAYGQNPGHKVRRLYFMPNDAIGNTPLPFTTLLCSNGALLPAATLNGTQTSLYVDDYAQLYLGEKDTDAEGFAPVVLHYEQENGGTRCINAEIRDVPFKMFLAPGKTGAGLTLGCDYRYQLQPVEKE